MRRSRIQWIDIAKAIAIILMVLGHSRIPNSLHNFIYSFHMPLFFFLSGWTTSWEKDSIIAFIYKKINSLIIPFILYSIVVILILPNIDKSVTLGSFICNGWQGYALWFIPVLFLSTIVYKLICAIKNMGIKIAVLLIFILTGCALSYYDILLPWSLSSVPFAVLCVAIGHYIKRYDLYIENFNCWYYIIFMMLSFFISQKCHLDLAFNQILPITLILIAALAGTFFIFCISSYISSKIRFLSVILQTIGRETYVIVAFSQLIILQLNHIADFNVLVKYICLVLILIILVLIKNCFKRFISWIYKL